MTAQPSAGPSCAVRWWDCHQIALYLAAIVLGALFGTAAPTAAPALEHAINPVLGLLLFATFLGVPVIEVRRALGDLRFLAVVLVANFIAVPVVVFGLSRFVTEDRGLLIGVLLVLLTPCIDYVIVFTGLAGGAQTRLLAAAPLLMLAQILLLPVYLYLFAGSEALGVVEIAPFVKAFFTLIVVPLVAAALVQALGRHHRTRPAGDTIERSMAAAMVPLMMATLAVVIGSQIAAVGTRALDLAPLVPLYAVFVAVALIIGKYAAQAAHLDTPAVRAVMFSCATRNSLVVLPLALALPDALNIAPLAVVTQTLVELLAMVILVRAVPRFAAGESARPTPSGVVSGE